MDEPFEPFGHFGPRWTSIQKYFEEKEKFFQQWIRHATGSKGVKTQQVYKAWLALKGLNLPVWREHFITAERKALKKYRELKIQARSKRKQGERKTPKPIASVVNPVKTNVPPQPKIHHQPAPGISSGKAIREVLRRGLPIGMAGKIRRRGR